MAQIQNLPRTLSTIALSDANTTYTPVAAVASKKVRVWGILISVATTCTVTIKSNTTGLTGAMTVLAGTPFLLPLPAISPKTTACYPYFESAVGEAIVIVLSSGIQVSGVMYYTQES